ncbi:MAG: cytochrome c oxidase assembly protein, partial [Acidimicrobiales bacterium]
ELRAVPGPWTWSPHPLAWVVVALGAAGYVAALRRLGPLHAPLGKVVTPGQVAAFSGALLALGLALSYPVADLARHTSAMAHVVQQLLLVLAVPPLALLGLPRWLLALATRSPRAEGALRAATHPAVAFVVFNAALVCAWVPPVVAAEAGSQGAADGVHLLLLCAGFVMWIPATRLVPGPRPLSAAARVAYLFAQSVVFNFPALILIFATRPLYAVYAHNVRQAIGIGPVADQQLAGAIAKFIGFAVLLGAVALILHHGWRAEEAGEDPDPLLWDDVERELRRLERRSKGTTDAG